MKELTKASGVWSMQSQYSAKRAGTWPKPQDIFTIDYLVVAGGGGSRCFSDTSGGGGAGGYRASGYGPSPLRGTAASVSGFCGASVAITVGGGGAKGSQGGPSTFDTITSAGGGSADSPRAGGSGGAPGGTGNSPPTDPPQGNDGGPNGGGGILGVGPGRCGGAGAPNLINCGGTPFSRTVFAGGGAGGSDPPGGSPAPNPNGGPGGGGQGGARGNDTSTDGAANSGGGAGGQGANLSGQSGGSGVVIVRGPSAVSFSVSPGTNATATHPGGDKIATFTVSGTLTIS